MTVVANPSVVTSGLVMYVDAASSRSYPGSGTLWYDVSGKNNNGTLINGPVNTAGVNGYFTFDGVDDYVTVTNGMNSLVGTNTVTFSAWIYRTSAPSYWAGIISNKVNVTDGICLLVNPDSKIFWQYDGGTSGVYAIYGGATLATNTWYNIAGVYDNEGLKTYLNGVLNESAADPGKSLSSAGNMDITLGSQSPAAACFPGRIAQCSVYNRSLSASEMLQNFNALRGRYGI
jgi:hypothetical protein